MKMELSVGEAELSEKRKEDHPRHRNKKEEGEKRRQGRGGGREEGKKEGKRVEEEDREEEGEGHRLCSSRCPGQCHFPSLSTNFCYLDIKQHTFLVVFEKI